MKKKQENPFACTTRFFQYKFKLNFNVFFSSFFHDLVWLLFCDLYSFRKEIRDVFTSHELKRVISSTRLVEKQKLFFFFNFEKQTYQFSGIWKRRRKIIKRKETEEFQLYSVQTMNMRNIKHGQL